MKDSRISCDVTCDLDCEVSERLMAAIDEMPKRQGRRFRPAARPAPSSWP
jgi:hypothetical protein